MDSIDIVRSVVTVVSLLCFLGIVYWAYSSAARKGFEEAARLPLDEDEQTGSGVDSRSLI
jgi:cytochrome c oxidase cbb3-type subunit IV